MPRLGLGLVGVRRRTIDPAVAALRLQAASGGQPVSMASPPTITYMGNAWTTASTYYAWNHAGFRMLNADWQVYGTGYPDGNYGSPRNITYDPAWGYAGGFGGCQGAVEFTLTSSLFEFAVKNAGNARYRIYVNGENGGETANVANDGGSSVFKVDFGSSASRTIRIEEVRGRAIFSGIRADSAPVATAAPSSRLVFFGDSFTEGTGASSRPLGLAHMIARELGFRDYLLSGSGGTGWMLKGTGNRYTGFERWTADVVNRNPTMLITCMGLNDQGTGNDATIQSTLPTKIAELLAARPNCLVHVCGIFDVSAPSGWGAGFESVNNAIRDAVTGLPRVWFHNLKGISFTKADSTHSDTAGHEGLYKAIYNKIAAVHGLHTVA